jgi:streptogramin lyase
MAASHFAGLLRGHHRDDRDAGAGPRRSRPRRPGVEALEGRCLLTLAAPPPIDQFAIPVGGNSPQGIAAGADGALWYTDFNGNQIGRITVAGAGTLFTVPTPSSEPKGIAAGPDGALWFTELKAGKIGRVTTAGNFSEFAIPTPGSDPVDIAAGPDGALWFTESLGGQIGRITTAGVFTEFPVPISHNFPLGIAAGPDGALWFTSGGSDAATISRMTTTGDVTEFPLPTESSLPEEIVTGPDGALWFTEFHGDKIGRITTAGAVTEFSVPTASSGPFGIAAGSDGALWFTELTAGKVCRITPAGTVTELSIPAANSVPALITAGPDGNLWFAESSAHQIGRVDLVGYRMADEPIPATQSGATGIAAGPDGNLWFTESVTSQIGRVTTAGAVTEFQTPTPSSAPLKIAAGPDGALWFTEQQANQIGRVTTAGQITEFPLPTAYSDPTGIAVGPDGALWFTEFTAGKIGRITTGGVISEFPIPSTSGGPAAIAAGPDGALWFTEMRASRIGRITTSGFVTEWAVSPSGDPDGIALGPDGNLWFTEPSRSLIGRLTIGNPSYPTYLQLPSVGSAPDGITAGPDGALWFTEFNAGGIGRITTDGAVTEFPGRVSSFPDAIAAGPDGALWFTEFLSNKIGRLALPLFATGTAPNATEGLAFSGVVATFAYPDPAATPADFAATIVWGDGTITPGQVAREATGDFVVSGEHTYIGGGRSYPASVAILDADSRTTIASFNSNVAPAPLAVTAAPLVAEEGASVPGGALLATFNDTGGADPLAAYAATVAWGDGDTGPATVLASGAGFRVVSAEPHTYADEGSYTTLVTITDANASGAVISTANASGAVTVADAPLMAATVPAVATPKGTPLVGAVVASFTDVNPNAQAGDFTATIDWGDGTATDVGLVLHVGEGTAFEVAGNHTYAIDRASPYPVTVTIRDLGGSELTTGSQATVADVAPFVSGIPVKMTKHLIFSAPVAYITEVPGAASEPAAHYYAATISWGDGTGLDTGTIQAIPGGAWVVGSHTYSGPGPYTVTVKVYDDGGAVVGTSAMAYDPPAQSADRSAAGAPITPAAASTTIGIPAGPRHHRRVGAHSGQRRRDAHADSHAHGRARVALAPGMALPRRVGMLKSGSASE